MKKPHWLKERGLFVAVFLGVGVGRSWCLGNAKLGGLFGLTSCQDLQWSGSDCEWMLLWWFLAKGRWPCSARQCPSRLACPHAGPTCCLIKAVQAPSLIYSPDYWLLNIIVFLWRWANHSAIISQPAEGGQSWLTAENHGRSSEVRPGWQSR